jgi:hypothetical protein
MSPAPDDTSREARAVLLDLYGRMSPADKVQRMVELNRAVTEIALAGLRLRHPAWSRQQLLRELARRRLGDELFHAAYGAGPHGD